MKKKILFLGYKFFGYEKEIIQELEKKYEVVYINIIPNIYILLINFFLRKFNLKEKYLKFKIKRILKNYKKIEFEKMLIIANENLTIENFNFICSEVEIKKIYVHIWDKYDRVKNINLILRKVDKITSFDRRDCINYRFEFVPTFYSKRLEKTEKIKGFFIGVYSPKRTKFIKKILENTEDELFVYLFMNFFIYIKLFFKKNAPKLKDIKFRKINKKKYNEILKSSEVVIDIIDTEQVGVTQRVLDAIYLQKKIITNCIGIKEYDFYNEENILVLENENDFKNIRKFINTKYEIYPEEVVKKYSLEKWVERVIDEDKS